MLFWLKKFVSFWLMPLPFCVMTLVIGLTLMRRPPRARLGRAMTAGALGLLIILGNNFVSKWLLRPLEALHPPIPELAAGAPLPAALARCRYVVVLGGGNGFTPGLAANHLLSSSATARIAEGVRVLRLLPEAKLIVSGPGEGSRPTHATVLARAAIALGIDPARIVYIDQARDTEDESQAVRRLAGDTPLALVTSAWHMPRAVALFRGAGLDPVACPTDFRAHTHSSIGFEDFLWDSDSLSRSTLAWRERLGLLWLRLRGRI